MTGPKWQTGSGIESSRVIIDNCAKECRERSSGETTEARQSSGWRSFRGSMKKRASFAMPAGSGRGGRTWRARRFAGCSSAPWVPRRRGSRRRAAPSERSACPFLAAAFRLGAEPAFYFPPSRFRPGSGFSSALRRFKAYQRRLERNIGPALKRERLSRRSRVKRAGEALRPSAEKTRSNAVRPSIP